MATYSDRCASFFNGLFDRSFVEELINGRYTGNRVHLLNLETFCRSIQDEEIHMLLRKIIATDFFLDSFVRSDSDEERRKVFQLNVLVHRFRHLVVQAKLSTLKNVALPRLVSVTNSIADNSQGIVSKDGETITEYRERVISEVTQRLAILALRSSELDENIRSARKHGAESSEKKYWDLWSQISSLDARVFTAVVASRCKYCYCFSNCCEDDYIVLGDKICGGCRSSFSL